MSRDNSSCGGCLGTILVVLVVGAAFGFVEWDTVGSFARFFVYFIIASLIFVGVFFIWSYLTNKND